MDGSLKDPDGYCPDDIVARLKRCISSGIEGIDYTIIHREKNEKLFKEYCIDTKKRREILESLTVEDYLRWEPSDKKQFSSAVYFFEKRVKLIPRYVEDAAAIPVDLYIKLTWNKDDRNILVVISFHEKEF